MTRRRALWGLGISLGVAATGAPALAQTPVDGNDSSPSAGIEDIVVTAQRRAENLQKSSVSIEVLSAEDIAGAGVSRVADLSTAVPGVQIGQGGGATQIYIRGVGDFSLTAITNPGVAFNVDGVYVARPAALEGNFFDVQRVEILKGPQGTLYGRNATGGAINVITNKPRLGVTEMAGAIEVGNYSKMLGEAAVNLPLGDIAAVRVAAQIVHRGPYSTNNYNDDIHQSVRGQLLFEPADNLRINVGADYIHVGGGGSDFVPLFRIPGTSPWISVTDAPVVERYLTLAAAQGLCAPRGPQFPTSPGNFGTYPGLCPQLVIPSGPLAGSYPQTSLVRPAAGERGRTNNIFYSVFGQLDYDVGPLTLTVLPAYRHASLDYVAHSGGATRYDTSVADIPETSKATSLEVRLSHDSDRLKAVAGFFYFDEKQVQSTNVTSGLVQDVAGSGGLITTRSYAGFGQATFGITDRLRIIGGLRYTYDRRHSVSVPYVLRASPFNPDGAIAFRQAIARGCVPGPVPNVPGFIGCPQSSHRGSFLTRKWNWKVGVEFDVAEQNMLYATASTGVKAGGLSTGQREIGVTNFYLPEELLAFEVGSRNRFFDNKLQLNLEAFYYDYKNHQEFNIGLDAIGDPAQLINNAGQGRAYGGNIDVVFKPTPDDVLRVGGEYLNTRYSSFVYEVPFGSFTPFLNPARTGCKLTTNGAPVFSQTVDCSGRPFTRAPKWTGIVSYAHSFDLGSSGRVTAEANMQFLSSRYLGSEYLPAYRAPANQVYNASLTYEAPGEDWSLTAYIRNIGNEAVYTASSRSTFVDNFAGASINPPRTFGARLNFRF